MKCRINTSPLGTSHFDVSATLVGLNPFNTPGALETGRIASFQPQILWGLAETSGLAHKYLLDWRDSVVPAPHVCWGLGPPKGLVLASH